MTTRTNEYAVTLDSGTVEISIDQRGDGKVRFTASGLQQAAHFAVQDETVHLDLNGHVFTLRETTLDAGGSARRDGASRLLAPMNGAIVSVLAKAGDPVAKGQRIVVLEAMKMQHEISAERDGTIDKILVQPGDQVATRQLLVELKPEESVAPASAEATP